ncbi:glucosyltransferase domain-containing protein [Butyrivibrio sp. WCD3002]|uniref:glucosyltransferase domain-containing protein n=1 Tax=Butyrivibrio sp. WCD3002 TaxID=1280676 RepID=UPI000428DD5C|nr:glucosyltransferase domain-containing protein [Butyrivibrio sp. WCD3002]
MNNRKNEWANKIYAYLITLILVVIAYQGFYRFGFESDTMTHYLNPLINIESKLAYTRYISYLVEISLYKIGYILPEHYRLSYMFFLIFTASTAFVYQETIIGKLREKRIEMDPVQEYMGRFILSLPLISTLYSEYFMFPECFAFSIGFLFSAIAVYMYSGKRYIGAILFLLMAVFTYQATVMLSAVYAILFVVIDEGYALTLRMFKRGLLTSLCCIAAGVINVITSKVVFLLGIVTDSPKALRQESVLDKFAHILNLLKAFLVSGNGLLPIRYANLMAIIAAIVLMIICHRYEKPEVVTHIFAGFIMFCLAIVIPLMQADAPRVIFVLYGALGCFVFLSFVQLDGKTLTIMQGVILCIVLLQIFSNQQIAVNHYISNDKDISCARAVLVAIDKYENETGITVEEIAVCEDSVSLNYFDDVYYTVGQINERVMHNVPYSLLEYVNKLDTGTTELRFRKSKVNGNKVREAYFAEKEWDSFNVYEQLIIDGNTAYWCIY